MRLIACRAPVVTMISSGSVGSPLAQYLSAMAWRSSATPVSSMPMSCRCGARRWAARVNASMVAAAGAEGAASARLSVPVLVRGAGLAVGAVGGSAVVLRAPRRALR